VFCSRRLHFLEDSGWLPWLNRVPENQREAFLARVLEVYPTHVPLDEAGHFAINNIVQIDVTKL